MSTKDPGTLKDDFRRVLNAATKAPEDRYSDFRECWQRVNDFAATLAGIGPARTVVLELPAWLIGELAEKEIDWPGQVSLSIRGAEMLAHLIVTELAGLEF